MVHARLVATVVALLAIITRASEQPGLTPSKPASPAAQSDRYLEGQYPLEQLGAARDDASPHANTDAPAARKEVRLPVETLREYAGEYPFAPGFVMVVTEQNGGLFAQATGQPRVRIYASAKDEFFYKAIPARLSFERDAHGKISGLVLHQAGRDKRAPRSAP